jgi:hypothetical protein
MNVVSEEHRDVIIGVVVTDREACLGRLLASLRPIDSDANVHVVVLDNGTQPSKILRLLELVDKRARGRRRCVCNSSSRAPLHETRVQLSRCIANLTRQWAIDEPIVWMVDDDLAFERFRLVDGQLDCQNVASRRIEQIRDLATRDRCDLLVSGFTGDAPVRPNSVISCQLSDLTAELKRLAGAEPTAQYQTAHVDPTRYQGDYYYSHSQGSSPQWREPYPWLTRSGVGPTVAEQLAKMLDDARGIEFGRGVFRPLLEERDSDDVEVVDSMAPNRGGNAVFFGVEPLLAHRYPAFPVVDGYSRRSDMIGATMLAREQGYRVAEANLSLRHDRRDQSAISAHPREWKREFAGVMLARMVMHGIPPGLSPHQYLRRIAERRAQRIHDDATHVTAEVQRALTTLDQPATCWWRDSNCRPLAHALRASLVRIRHTFEQAHRSHVFEALVAGDLLRGVLGAYTSLHASRSVL